MSPEPSTRATRILTESVYPRAGVETSTITQQIFAADRSRGESLAPPAIAFQIERRDLRQRFEVFASQKEYRVLPLFDVATEREKAAFLHSGRRWRRESAGEAGDSGREMNVTFTYQPTGEEQLMFGCVARHWIVHRRDEHRPEGNWKETITDAWYLDSQQLAGRFAGFSGDLVHHTFAIVKMGGARELINHSGERPSGVCALLESKSLHHSEGPGGEVHEYRDTSSVRVISIREVSVPLSVFEPPKGFRKIPVYPSRFTMTRRNLTRGLRHFFRVSA